MKSDKDGHLYKLTSEDYNNQIRKNNNELQKANNNNVNMIDSINGTSKNFTDKLKISDTVGELTEMNATSLLRTINRISCKNLLLE